MKYIIAKQNSMHSSDKRSLNISKMLVLRRAAHALLKCFPLFVVIVHMEPLVSASGLSSLLSQPVPLIIWATGRGRLGQGWQFTGWCWIRIKLTWCQYTSRKKSAYVVKRICSFSLQWIPVFVTPSVTQELPLLPWNQSWALQRRFLQGQLARELQAFVSDVTLSTITRFLKIRLWQHIPHRKVSWLSLRGQYRI